MSYHGCHLVDTVLPILPWNPSGGLPMSGFRVEGLGVVEGLLTQEVEFGREGQGIAIGHEGIVALVLRSHVINHQLVEP